MELSGIGIDKMDSMSGTLHYQLWSNDLAMEGLLFYKLDTNHTRSKHFCQHFTTNELNYLGSVLVTFETDSHEVMS